jgi:hypothetical protein
MVKLTVNGKFDSMVIGLAFLEQVLILVQRLLTLHPPINLNSHRPGLVLDAPSSALQHCEGKEEERGKTLPRLNAGSLWP